MKFDDKVQIICVSWKWWDWATSARREAWVPYGWPNGGNGGHWGSVIFKADRNYNTLLHLRFQKEREAQDGFPWESTDKYWKSAEDRIILVPVGSIIKVITSPEDTTKDDTEPVIDIVYHFTFDGEEYRICKWGIGWAWNMHFKNSLVQFPDFSLFGEPGQRKTVEIELQLLADVWLIGMPSVGKSSIINSLSQSKAKVAEYHFTTLIPNLWSVSYHDISWNIIDIPGLIKWASEWKWLGNEFLRHVLKARLFVFVLDITRWDQWIWEFWVLWNEIVSYIKTRFVWSKEFWFLIEDIRFELRFIDKQLVLSLFDQQNRLILQKAIVRVINKIDEAMDQEIQKEYQDQLIKNIITLLESDQIHHRSFADHHLFVQQIFFYSTILDNLKKPLLQFMFDKLQWITEYQIHFDTVAATMLAKSKWIQPLWEIDQPSIRDLFLELGYHPQDFEDSDYLWMISWEEKWETNDNKNFDDDDSTTDMSDDESNMIDLDGSSIPSDATSYPVKRLFKVYEPELTRLSYQLPWWKVLAEERFWRVMKQQWFHKRFNKLGVKTGDILWVVGNYDSNKHILFPYVLGDNKTSYKHQKLT